MPKHLPPTRTDESLEAWQAWTNDTPADGRNGGRLPPTSPYGPNRALASGAGAAIGVALVGVGAILLLGPLIQTLLDTTGHPWPATLLLMILGIVLLALGWRLRQPSHQAGRPKHRH